MAAMGFPGVASCVTEFESYRAANLGHLGGSVLIFIGLVDCFLGDRRSTEDRSTRPGKHTKNIKNYGKSPSLSSVNEL